MPVNYDTSFLDHLAPNVAVQFLDRVAKSPDREAYRYPKGDGWQSVTWRETGEQVRRLAAGLLALGIEPEQRVGIASDTRYEWILADLAVMCAGAATTTVYPSTNAADTSYILSDSECRVVFAENDEQIAKLKEHKAELPHLLRVVTFDGTTDDSWVIDLEQLAQLGDGYLDDHPEAIEETAKSIGPDQLATLIYTSGTTGRPKGVRLRHRSWVYEGAAIEVQDILHEDDLQFLWLPMAHSFGKVLLSTQLACGFATAIDGRVDKIVENLGIVKPTFMGAAPRIFEKAYNRVTTMVADEGGVKARLFGWAIGVGGRVAAARQGGERPTGLLALEHALADRLVLRKVRERFGGRIRFFISGSAALNRDVADWFEAVGMLILEGYGLTETSAASFVNRPHSYVPGSVGLPVPGTEVCIADDGEVLIKGPGVMEGYHHQAQATAEALDPGGWLHTGDLGQLDARGFLRVTDRKKDLFKTSGGKAVAPSAIESMFKGICPYVSHMLVHGDGRNYVTALITLDLDEITTWGVARGMAGSLYREMATCPAAYEMVQGYVDELNSRLNRWETIKKFVILPRDLSVEHGELTPSLKLRRRAVEDRFRAELDALYTS